MAKFDPLKCPQQAAKPIKESICGAKNEKNLLFKCGHIVVITVVIT
jgi:hypothetical protein